MPSPLNGFTLPAASPTTRKLGPALGPTDPPIGMRPLRRLLRRLARVDLPTVGNLMCVGIQQVSGVDALEVAERAEQTDADVDGAVAHREDPAVARASGCRCDPSRRARIRSTARRGAASPNRCGWRCRRATRVCGTCRARDRSGCWRRRRRPRTSRGSRALLRRRRPPLRRARSHASTIGCMASCPISSVAPAACALSATIWSSSRRRTTYPCCG